MNRITSSKHLESISEIAVIAPLKAGFVPSLDAVSYRSRVQIVMRALFDMRQTAREYSEIRPFVDTAERIQSLLDFRISIIEDDAGPRVLLTANFDRPFEPYLRLIHWPLGPLLDIVFCNCEGYPAAVDNDFETYVRWVRTNQLDCDFFYAPNNQTVTDAAYLAKIERMHREAAGDISATIVGEIAEPPATLAARVRAGDPDRTNDIGVEALLALYRLADYFPPDVPSESRFLQRAAWSLIGDWDVSKLPPPLQLKLATQIAWLKGGKPPAAAPAPSPPPQLREVQAGILTDQRVAGVSANHGALMLMRIVDPARARKFLAGLALTSADDDLPAGAATLNVAFTAGGLERLGAPADVQAALPQEFREGMSERAGLLGDIGPNHPRRWDLPRRNWPKPAGAPPPVELCDVDVVVQLRTASDSLEYDVAGNPAHPLYRAVEKVAKAGAGAVELLSVETTRSAAPAPVGDRAGFDHFGFKDGLSQPRVRDGAGGATRDDVALGELLWGHATDRGDPAAKATGIVRDCLLNGSFLAIRKLKQDVRGFDAFLTSETKRLAPEFPNWSTERLRRELMAKLMGRQADGASLVPLTGPGPNDFDFSADPKGAACPFQSHIRRTNPRTNPAETHGRPVPRIMRRGMSYGPPAGTASPDAARGIMFMAYNASLAEQFEVIQGWLAGSNSTGVASAQSDPIMGTARPGDQRVFTFAMDGKVVRLPIPQPFVVLAWGLYLFVPSWTGLQKLCANAADDADAALVEQGRTLIEAFRKLPPAKQGTAWKTALEDPLARDPDERGEARALWAAIQADHGGAIRVPYGASPPDKVAPHAVLVGAADLVATVLENDKLYSVEGYMPRMEASMGRIFLGLDAGREHSMLSAVPNAAVAAITDTAAFDVAYRASQDILKAAIERYRAVAGTPFAKVDLKAEFVVPVLSAISAHWFGIPNGELSRDPQHGGEPDPTRDPPVRVAGGGWTWRPFPRVPRCPGDFTAPSRYCFYPDPTLQTVNHGQVQGQELTKAVNALLQDAIDRNVKPKGIITTQIFEGLDQPLDVISRTVIGVMIGFLPPAYGALLGTLFEWTKRKQIWQHQRALTHAPGTATLAKVDQALRMPLMRTLAKRPSPELLWRKAKATHDLGEAKVRRNDKLILGLAPAMVERPGCPLDIHAMFGGDRSKPGHPTHACPGYDFAMGSMLGILTALLEPGRIELLPANLFVSLTPHAASAPPPPVLRTVAR